MADDVTLMLTAGALMTLMCPVSPVSQAWNSFASLP